MRADLHEHEVQRQREHVIQRQRNDRGFLAVLQVAGDPRAPPAAGWRPCWPASASRPWRRRWCRRCTAGTRGRRGRWRRRPASASRPAASASVKPIGLRQMPLGHHLLHVLDDQVGQHPLERREHVADLGRDDGPHAGRAQITSSSVCAKFSSTTIAVAPESFSWCSSSRGVYSGLVFTTTMPARCAPKSAIGYCSRFGSMIATRSPFFSPATFCR